MESRMEEYLNAAISGDTENLPNPISRIDFLLCELIKTLGESGASIEEVEKIVTDKVAEIVADAPEDFDTLKELSDWIYTHEESAAAMNTAIQSNSKSIENLTTNLSNKADSDYVYDKTTADNRFLGINDTASNSYRWGNILNEMGTQNDSGTWLLVLNKDRVQHRLSTDFAGSAVTDEKFANARNDIALNRTTLGYQHKNLLKNTASTTTVNNVTFTVNSDGSITAKQTTTAPGNATIDIATNITLNPGTYILTGDDEIKKSGYGEIRFYINGTIYTANTAHTFDEEVTISAVRIFVWSGVNINGSKTIYPMLRYADITDNTYEPYKENIDERITNNVSDIAISRTTIGYQCKNLLKPISGTTRAGITYTVNEDGSVTLTGASTTGSTYNYFSIPITLKPGKYKVNGMPETSSNTTYRVDLRANESGGTAYGYGAKEFEVEFAETTTAYYMIRIDGSYKEELNGITFYPMIRYADIIDDTYEPYSDSVDERILENKSDIVINKTTLGYQRKNLFNETEYLSSIASVSIGTFNISGNSITLTATGRDCYTKPHASGDGGYRIPVTPDTDYILSWESDNSNDGYVYAFMNGSLSQLKLANNKNTKYFKFTTNSNTTFITIRLGVSNSGESITYSNIMLRYADILDNTYEPYQPSLHEQIAALEARIAALEV